ncbi:MAG: AmmeMemoRadiSam system protein B [Thermodesulfobacteriota bacterium]
MKRRKAVFAGSWYPDRASACETEIRSFLADAGSAPGRSTGLVGGIVPHAGWYYSGKIACNVIQRLAEGPAPDVILLFGMHLHPHSANYIMAEGAWETPFGDLAIAADMASRLTGKFPFRVETAERFTEDNTIELQLPFVKYFFPDSRILPMGVPPNPGSLEIGRYAVEQALELGLKVKVLGSTDLTHYGAGYGFAPRGAGKGAHEWVRLENDRAVITAMLAMDPLSVLREAERKHNACCAGAAATAIAAGQALGAGAAEQVAYATSYEKHPGDSFVGYVGIVF